MSKKDIMMLIVCLFGTAALITGCSSARESSTSFDPNTGRHLSGWSDPSVHGTAAKSQADGFASCQECHGADFTGGIAATSCFTCHGVSAPHAPAPWRGGVYTHTTTDPGNAPVCAQCHADGANSSVQPSPSAPAGTAPGCFNNTLCHATPGHPAGWSDPAQHGASAKAAPNAATTSGFSTCQTCHGNSFSGGTANIACASCHGGSAPHPTSWISGTYTHTNTNTANAAVCVLCHADGANSPIAPPSPPAPAGTAPGCFNNTLCHAEPACGSCHGIPPSGTTFPNTAGRHGIHTGLGSYITCDTCHTGAGSGTANHQNGVADVAFDPAYNAKSVAASFNAAASTCSSVSCHGGQTTPAWPAGTIDVNTQCTSCHSYGTTEYNSFNSGQHNRHVNQQHIACTQCHDTTKLAANHFTHLDTHTMEGPASATLLNSVNYNGTSCNPACHGTETW